MRSVQDSTELRDGTRALLDRALHLSGRLRETRLCQTTVHRGGRKAHRERTDAG